MNETLPPADFDWVTARSQCSAESVYEALRGLARANMLTRNDILDASEDRDRFKMNDHPPRGFTIWDTWGHTRRALDVTLKDGTFTFSRQLGDSVVDFTATMTLTDSGVCKFKAGNEVLDSWQILKRALEPLFF